MKKKLFIDGSAGTTGLEIAQRIEKRDDLDLIVLSEEERKDISARKRAINESDITILCLPDDAARQSVSLCENEHTVILDASTAHRTAPGWVYGMPELAFEQKEKIIHSKRVAVPGCHASGFIALISPLVSEGVISKDTLLTCHSITGYSGGGKKMIAQYESENPEEKLFAPRQYGLSQNHKHLPEMLHMTGLTNAPVFCPIVSNFYSGMLVCVPLFSSQTVGGMEKVVSVLRNHYDGTMNIEYIHDMSDSGFVDSNLLSSSDKMQISVTGNDERMTLFARYNNLGKGASGAAVQCLDLILSGLN